MTHYIAYFTDSLQGQLIFLLLIIWSLIWKGIALWKSARNGQKKWFIPLLIINTFGILEIIYVFYFSKPKDKKPEEPLT